LGVFLPLLLSDYISKADLSPLFEKLPDDYSKKFRLRLDKKLLTFNSINHKRRGQSVLFGGSDVIFQTERSELV
jgi:hypothetical protein